MRSTVLVVQNTDDIELMHLKNYFTTTNSKVLMKINGNIGHERQQLSIINIMMKLSS